MYADFGSLPGAARAQPSLPELEVAVNGLPPEDGPRPQGACRLHRLVNVLVGAEPSPVTLLHVSYV